MVPNEATPSGRTPGGVHLPNGAEVEVRFVRTDRAGASVPPWRADGAVFETGEHTIR